MLESEHASLRLWRTWICLLIAGFLSDISEPQCVFCITDSLRSDCLYFWAQDRRFINHSARLAGGAGMAEVIGVYPLTGSWAKRGVTIRPFGLCKVCSNRYSRRDWPYTQRISTSTGRELYKLQAPQTIRPYVTKRRHPLIGEVRSKIIFVTGTCRYSFYKYPFGSSRKSKTFT